MSISNHKTVKEYTRRSLNESSMTKWNWYRHINWVNLTVIIILPLLALYKSFDTPLTKNTLQFSISYYLFTVTCFQAGYHRLWAHRSFTATSSIKFIYAVFGTSCGLGSIKTWVPIHRAHHRYIDTEKDPHHIRKGLWYSHFGWIILNPKVKVKNSIKECYGDDLDNEKLIDWQSDNYHELAILTGLLIPCLICGIFWNDYFGGLIYAGVLRAFIIQQNSFFVNSIGHVLGTQPYDDRKSHRNNWALSFLTFGEGSNNFHHEFSADFRNGIHWYEFDPVKYHILSLYYIGLVTKINRTADTSIVQCLLQQEQKLIDRKRSQLNWGVPIDRLPIISSDEFTKWAKEIAPERALVAVAGIVHDVTPFVNDHPGGISLIKASIGKDATSAFNGAVYDHSTAAHNLLATMRIAVLSGGTEKIVWKQQQAENKDVPLKQDSQGNKIVRTGEQATIVKKTFRTADAA
ncbi:hypothetical protein WICMUC_003743 [Wickerhamomyces mucosus]|uniref:Acyl-CoA desaturase n=1 Tax=Wickerhamomyces mucosus TaxID=1378264 RepID=A0A9P8PKX5_9ASCO|nr:hypothetical protein WICMUC_003743 [Wickerhamomyces mucosus]